MEEKTTAADVENLSDLRGEEAKAKKQTKKNKDAELIEELRATVKKLEDEIKERR